MNDYLYHHGILGMKWGVRRYQNKDGGLTPAGKERYNKKRVKNLTDEEIAETMVRLNKEKELLSLQGEVVKMSAGRNGKIAGDFIETFAKKAVTDVVADVGSQVITYILASAINKATGKDIIKTNKGESKGKINVNNKSTNAITVKKDESGRMVSAEGKIKVK